MHARLRVLRSADKAKRVKRGLRALSVVCTQVQMSPYRSLFSLFSDLGGFLSILMVRHTTCHTSQALSRLSGNILTCHSGFALSRLALPCHI